MGFQKGDMMMNETRERFEVDTLWVDSILTSSVPVDWEPAYGVDGDGFRSFEAPSCPSCGEYGVWNADAHRWECGNGGCDDPPEEIDDDTEGPMMNYHYPLPDLDRIGTPYDAAEAISDLPLCVVEWDDGSYSLALTGGGMDLSWEICEAFTRLGFCPPFRFARDLPKLAGHNADPYVIAACKRSCRIVGEWAERASADLEERYP